MSKRKNMQNVVQGFSSNPMDKALYDGAETEETDALFSALSDMKRGSRAAIVPTDGNGELAFNGWTLSPQGLIAPETVTETDYEQIGRVLLRLDSSMQWLIGDWINTGDNFQWGETYTRIADDFGYEVKTLRQFAYVARNVEMSVRYRQLSFGHHERVASMEPEAQEHWLERAANEGLSISKMRAAIKESQLPPPAQLPLTVGAAVRYAETNGWVSNLKTEGDLITEVCFSYSRGTSLSNVTNWMKYKTFASRFGGFLDNKGQPRHDIDELNAAMPEGVTVEEIGTYNASEMGRMYDDLAEALQPGTYVKTRAGHIGEVESVQGKQAVVRTGSYTSKHNLGDLQPARVIDEADTYTEPEPQTDGFSHELYRKHQDMWADARRAFEDVRTVDASRFTGGKVGRATRNKALNTIRDLIEHLHYVESQLQD